MLIRSSCSVAVVCALGLLVGAPGPLPGQTRADVLASYKAAEKLKAESRLPEAAQEYEKAVRLARQALGEDHTDTATVMNSLGLLYRSMGEYAKAEPLYTRSLAIRETKLGKDHPNVAQSLNNLAVLYWATKQYAKAEPLYLRSLQIRETKLGKDHLDVAHSLHNLADLYRDMGQAAKAEPLYLRSLQIRETKLGKDHPDTATAVHSLATVYRVLGEYAKAEPLCRRYLNMCEARFGADHPATAEAMNHLALLYETMSEYAKAEPLYQRSLQIRQSKLGKDHALTAQSMHNLASLYGAMGEYAKAEPLYTRSLEIRETKLGKDHADVAYSLNGLALLYRNMGEYAKAEPLYLRSLQIREAKRGQDHPDVATSLSNLAELYRSMSQYAKAEPLYQRSLEIREAKLGQDHPDVATSLNNLADLYRDMGQHAKGEPLYTRGLQIREAKFGKDHPAVAISLNDLGALYRAMGQYTKAEPLYRRSLDIRAAKFGEDHTATAASMNHLALLYRAMGDYVKAEALSTRSLEIRQTKLGKDHPLTAQSLNNLALLYMETGRFAKAEPLYRQSLDIYEKKVGKDHPDTALPLNNLAVLYQKLGAYAKAEPLYTRSLQIRENSYGKDHPQVANSLNNLGALYAAKGDAHQAAIFFHRARRVIRRHAARVLPVLSEREQLDFLKNNDVGALHRALSVSLEDTADDALRRRGAEWLLNGKAVAQEALAAGPRAALASHDPQTGVLVRELQEVRRQLARLALTTLPPGQEEAFRQRREELTRRERDLTVRLARLGGSSEREDPWVDLDELCRRLPADAAFIDVTRFRLYDFRAKEVKKAWGPARYAAWVTFASGKVEVIDLGEAAPIDELVQKVRQEVQVAPKTIRQEGEPDAEKLLLKPLRALSEAVLHPLLKHIGGKQRWVLSPDGDLWLVPWNALPLPDGSYVVEKHTLSLVTSGRDLVGTAAARTKAGPSLVLADPDFDLGKDKVATQTKELLGSEAGTALPALTGRKLPGKIGSWACLFQFGAVGELRVYDREGNLGGQGRWQQDGPRLSMQTKIARLEGSLQGDGITGRREKRDPDGSVTKDTWQILLPAELAQRSLAFVLPVGAAPRLPKVVRLPGTATEARAVTPRLKEYAGTAPLVRTGAEAVKAAVRAAAGPKVLLLSTHGFFPPAEDEEPADEDRGAVQYKNPLLRCGLLLAGCNDREEPGQGVLTGLEVAGLDLRGTELVVLSACETGLGEARQGEGVAGLRQAFQLAGAEAVVATLWQVPDRQSALLVARTFELLAAGQSKAEALRQAQLEVVRARREANAAAHPFFWAAFTVTGRADRAAAAQQPPGRE